MRIAGYAICLLLGATWLSAQQDRQNTKGCDAAKEREMFATNRAWSKGGIGIISEELYVVVKSARNDRNELILTPPGHLGKDQSAPVPETRWKGKSIREAEVVFVYHGNVWESGSLPKGFDLSKSVVISFEGDKVRFFDFRATDGGYYDRSASKSEPVFHADCTADPGGNPRLIGCAFRHRIRRRSRLG